MRGPHIITETPTVTATPDYSDGDSIGGVLSVRTPTPTAAQYLSSITISSKAAISVGIDALIFNANPSASTFTDNSTASVHANDAAKLIGSVSFADDGWIAGGTPVVQSVPNANVPVLPASTIVYVALVARGTINLGSTSDLTVHFGFLEP